MAAPAILLLHDLQTVNPIVFRSLIFLACDYVIIRYAALRLIALEYGQCIRGQYSYFGLSDSRQISILLHECPALKSCYFVCIKLGVKS